MYYFIYQLSFKIWNISNVEEKIWVLVAWINYSSSLALADLGLLVKFDHRTATQFNFPHRNRTAPHRSCGGKVPSLSSSTGKLNLIFFRRIKDSCETFQGIFLSWKTHFPESRATFSRGAAKWWRRHSVFRSSCFRFFFLFYI